MSDDDRGRKPDQATVRVRPSERSAGLAQAAPVSPSARDAATRPMGAATGDAPAIPEGAWDEDVSTHQPGATLGRYVVLSLLGAGGMGEVYTAYDPALDRRVALKVIKPFSDKGSLSGARGALLAEAQALAKLAHPNVVAVYDVGTIDDDVYIAMEYVEGTTLNTWMRTERPLDEVLDVFVAAGRGLEAAHAAGIVHRDFKPDNVIIGKDGRVRVIDFGIAQQGPAEASDAIVGTVAYMAPEQFKREKVGPAADQFSFAVALYTGVYRQYPFDGTTEDAISANICAGKMLPLPTTSKVPARLRDAIQRALSVDPALRFPAMHELLVTIKPPPRRSRLALAIAGAVAVAAAATITILATRGGAPEPCSGFERDLAGIWDPTRKVAIEGQVKAAAWPAIEKLFDTYVGDWTKTKQSACRATAVTREQTPLVLERRMTCLDTRLRELDAAVAIVAAGGVASARAIDIGSNLRSPSSCSNLASLAPLPSAPAPAIVAVEASIAQVRAKRLAGQFREARTATEAAITSAKQLGWTGAVARTLVERGLAEAADGDPKAARETLFEAVRTSEEARDAASEAAGWIGLVSVEAAGLRAPSEALRWAKHAEISLANAGNDQEQQAELLHNIAGALRVLDRNAEALDHERRALALLEHAFGSHHVRIANQRAAIATTLRQLGQLDDAIREAEAALKILEELAGLTHPYAASLLNGLALTYDEAGRIEDARKALERAIVISELELGPTHLRLANPLMNLVALERRAGRADAAEAFWDRAYAIRSSNLGANHPDVTRALHGKLLDRMNRGLEDEARALINEVITRQRQRTDAIELASALSLRCELERRAGQLDAAAATCTQAMAELPTPHDPVRSLYVYSYAARVAADRNDLPAARKLVAEAQAFLANATRDRNVARGVVGWAAAHTALAGGQREEAVNLAAEARASLLTHGKNFGYLVRDLEKIR